jgi:hypothetical protein
MAAHIPTVVWSLRAPEYAASVSTYDGDSLRLQLREIDGCLAIVYISRKDARLLAKRINQCLDDTTAKGKYGRGSAS